MLRATTLCLAWALALGSAPASAATITFFVGPPLPSVDEEEPVFLDGATNVTSFTGNVGSQTGQPEIQGTTDVAVNVAEGFSVVTPATDANIGSLTFSVPGFTFADLIFRANLDTFGSPPDQETFPLTIEAFGSGGSLLDSQSYSLGELGSGNLQFLVLSTLSNIDSVVISSLIGSEGGLTSLGQFEVSGLAPIPIPPALPLLAAGIVGLGWLSRRRKRKSIR